MTIQWTLVATFLYLELAFLCLLLLPFVSPKVWRYVFYSRFCKIIADKANIYFTVFIIVLIFFFLDSIREMWNYSSKTSVDLGQELQIQLKLFRSQRNYYISGFTVFLWLVIRRLVMLVLYEADLLSENESTMKRAQSATETVEKILKREEQERKKSTIAEDSSKEVNAISKAIEETRCELENTIKRILDVKQKSVSVSKEYEALSNKHTTLLNKITEDKNRSENRKVTDNEEEEKTES